MKTTAYVTHSDCSLHDTGWAHPEHQGRLAGIARAVYRDMLTLYEPLLELEPAPATRGDLLLAHSREYIDRVRAASEAAEETGTVHPFGAEGRVSGRTWDAAVAAVGAGITAADAVLDGTVRNAFCAVRPPGSDVGVDGGFAFGIFNTAAIAARHLQVRHGIEAVLVLEIGAAAGVGTAQICSAHAGLRYTGVHQRGARGPTWPGDARVLAVEAGASGVELEVSVEQVLARALEGFRPEFLVLSLGLDLLEGDPVGGLAVQPSDVYDLTKLVEARATELCGGRMISILEGGFDARASGTAVVQHLRALSGLPAA